MRQKFSAVDTELVVVGSKSLCQAQDRVSACQNCSSGVSRLFRSVLIDVLGVDHPMSEFVMADPALCPNCDSPIFENTLVRCKGEPRSKTAIAYPATPFLEADTNVVLINESFLAEAANWITGCQCCTKGAEMTFDYILDAIMDSEDPNTEYVMCRPVQCPRCQGEVTEKTRIVVH